MASLTLTFDNGPDPTWTPHVLDVLAKHEIKATFFVIGRKLVLQPELRSILERARDEGHWIGTHSYNHVYSLGDIDREDAFDVEVVAAFDAVGDLAHPDRLYRPFCNAGIVNDRVFKQVDVERLEAAATPASSSTRCRTTGTTARVGLTAAWLTSRRASTRRSSSTTSPATPTGSTCGRWRGSRTSSSVPSTPATSSSRSSPPTAS